MRDLQRYLIQEKTDMAKLRWINSSLWFHILGPSSHHLFELVDPLELPEL